MEDQQQSGQAGDAEAGDHEHLHRQEGHSSDEQDHLQPAGRSTEKAAPEKQGKADELR